MEPRKYLVNQKGNICELLHFSAMAQNPSDAHFFFWYCIAGWTGKSPQLFNFFGVSCISLLISKELEIPNSHILVSSKKLPLDSWVNLLYIISYLNEIFYLYSIKNAAFVTLDIMKMWIFEPFSSAYCKHILNYL